MFFYDDEEVLEVTTLADIAGKTRSDVALAALADATTRARRLEHEAEQTFTELARAQELCQEERISVDLELDAGLAAAFSAWRQRQARAGA